MVADTLRRFATQEWRYTHLPFGERRDPATAGKLKRMGTTPGWPDFMFVRRADEHGGGKVCFLELKRKLGHAPKLSAYQADIAAQLVCAGCGFALVDNFKDAVDALKDFGVIPPTVNA